jgi:hypothetical protein
LKLWSIPRLTQSPDYGSAHSPAFVNPGRTCYECGIVGASESSIMNQTGRRSVQMVRRYIGDGSLFQENRAAKLDLERSLPVFDTFHG